MTSALDLVDLRVDRGGRSVVRDLSASVESGHWLGVVGANGSGKTTLLRAVSGRLPIAAGRCAIEGQEMAADRSARANRIGFAPPIERLPGLLTVRALLEIAGEALDRQRDRNADLWAALGIDGLLDRAIGESSSGMRQRAAIALAFARPMPIVVLDEPFNWLDPVAAFDTRAALANLVRAGTTLLTAVHDLTTLCGACDHGVVMAGGAISLELDRETLRAGSRDIDGFEREMIAALRR
ncbi:ABC transporter ATP-binding protein [Sphingomonas sp.]|uniref:ATP-binding cassette domain-containing protein n=1 Tax=Sphingomonas sp. TaxID=28214 RepID=UPI001EC47EA8|nr:ABC transporter ATP-binding protein [Sphingomonas sp.]MBX3593971.1 ABC transporter ATP-binding protein [Sphingomonas sp.]